MENKIIQKCITDLGGIYKQIDPSSQDVLIKVKQQLLGLESDLSLGYVNEAETSKMLSDAEARRNAKHETVKLRLNQTIVDENAEEKPIIIAAQKALQLVVKYKEDGSFNDGTTTIITVENGDSKSIMKQIKKILKTSEILNIKKF